MAITDSFRGVILTIPFAIHLAVADLLISLLLPLSFLFPQWTYHASSSLAAGVWSHIQRIFEQRNGARITHSYSGFPESDTSIDIGASKQHRHVVAAGGVAGESALVVSNHVSWTDFYLLQSLSLATRPAMLPYARYFAKASLKWVPLLGWGLWALRMPLVSRRWADDRAEIERVFRGPRLRREPIWLVMFSEGTRWTAAKWERAVAWARQNARPEPGRHVLAPRSKGFVASVKGLRDGGIACVLDVTLAYARRSSRDGKWTFMAAPDMWTSLASTKVGTDYAFWIHAERFDISSLPAGDEELGHWLEERWVAKGKRLELLASKIDAQSDISNLTL